MHTPFVFPNSGIPCLSLYNRLPYRKYRGFPDPHMPVQTHLQNPETVSFRFAAHRAASKQNPEDSSQKLRFQSDINFHHILLYSPPWL